HDFRAHRSGCGTPFGEERVGSGEGCVEQARDVFGTAIVVGHVEAVEARLRIVGHVGRRLAEVDPAAVLLHIGDLPKTGYDAADFKPWRELDAVGTTAHACPVEDERCSKPNPPTSG